MKTKLTVVLAVLAAAILTNSMCAAVEPAIQAKIDVEMVKVKALAADPTIVAAIKAHNAGLTADEKAMTQEKWKTLTLLDPFVRSYSKNPAGLALKAGKSEAMSEAFASGADGVKVAFLSKPSNWNHAGKPKHDVPMTGKSWQGEIELDESTGLQAIQVSVPVLDGATPIGSLVIGLSVNKLKG